MIRELWLRAQLWAFRRRNPRLEAKVARNDVGDALGIRAVYLHPSGRRDAMGLSLKAARAGSDAAIIIGCQDDLLAWMREVQDGALHAVRR